jgi:chromate transporter
LLLLISGLLAVLIEYRKNIYTYFNKLVSLLAFPVFLYIEKYTLQFSKKSPGLDSLGLVFLKVGSVLYGGGYVLIAFLKSDVIDIHHWITNQQLIDSIAVGQFTPGPVLSTATFIGYLIHRITGAVIATFAIFLPPFIFVSVLFSLLTN